MGAAGSVQDASYDATKFAQSKAIMELAVDDAEKFAKLKEVWNVSKNSVTKEPSPEPQPATAKEAKEAPQEPKETAAPKEAPKEAPASSDAKEAPKEAAKDAPKEAAKEAPKEAATEAAKEAPKEAAKEAPKDAPKEVAKDSRLDVEGDQVVYILPKMVSPWKFRNEVMSEAVICDEYERMAAFIEAYQAREEASARHRPFQKSAPLGSPTFRQVLLPPLPDPTSLDPQLRVQVHRHPLPRFIPGTIEQKEAFWDVMDAYHRHRAAKLARDRKLGVCVYDFNQVAAGRPEVLETRHAEWVRRRIVLDDECAENRRLRQDEADLHVQETTTAARIDRRHRQHADAVHRADVRRVLPMVLAAAAGQWFRHTMWETWQSHRCQRIVRQCAMRWRHHTLVHIECTRHATLLCHWLHESVKVKSLAHKVFYALRVYLRRVTLIQSFWRQKIAIRTVQVKRLDAQWTTFVNTPDATHDPAKADLLPHLIQSLQGLHPNKSRSEVRAIAARHFALGSVHSTLQGIPGALAPPPPPPHHATACNELFAMLPLVTKAYQVQNPSYFQMAATAEAVVIQANEPPPDMKQKGQPSSRSRVKKGL
ncbi:hypothetical protein DYB26_000413 [Aphanomyces astaci]|uniref:Uncharacterized protein n=1 Tax=Aphanomyces astaci TaxID=112090 RepID=A0A3R7AMK2_APHAT|nr:hypothetical protein DYB26_000413 [Aphanomyces astaci]